MRTKVTLVLVFLNVALFAYIFHFERAWRTEAASREARRRVLGPEAARITTLEVEAPGGLRPVELDGALGTRRPVRQVLAAAAGARLPAGRQHRLPARRAIGFHPRAGIGKHVGRRHIVRERLRNHCKLGGRSAFATALLERHGFDVTNLAGGFEAWKKSVAPVSS